MSAGFQAVQWNRDKRIYDAVLLAAVAAYIAAFVAYGAWAAPPDNALAWIDLRIRAFGSAAFLMMTAILAIGPLARLDPRWLKALYNRRHFGVLAFFVALSHALFMLEWYIARGALGDLLGELTDPAGYTSFTGFQFKTLGIVALLIMFAMAATSHDYWLAFLTPRVWKAVHMGVYLAYGLIVLHVALGVVQFDTSNRPPIMIGLGFALVAGLHLAAGWRETRRDRAAAPGASSEWLAVGPPASIPDRGARIVVTPEGERIAVFRNGDEIGAVTNACAHQNGPPDGCAPAPYTEKLATYRVRLRDGMIEVESSALAPGTPAAIRVSL